MRLRIGTIIALSFGTIILFFLVNTFIINNTLEKTIRLNDKISNIYTPSLNYTIKLYNLINESKVHIKSWVTDRNEDTPSKLKLKEIISNEYFNIYDTLKSYSKYWEDPSLINAVDSINFLIKDSLFILHKKIMSKLTTWDDYEDPAIVWEVQPMVEETGEVMILSNEILQKLEAFRAKQEQIISKARTDMIDIFNGFRRLIVIMTIIIVFLSIGVGLFTIVYLTRPINKTKNILLNMSKGILPSEKLPESNDEIGQMSRALNMLVNGLKEIQVFSTEIGQGNYDYDFKPLSDDDILGQSLLDMKNKLKKAKEEEEKRKIEDSHRNWASIGLAKFSDILRQNNDNLEKLSYEVISNLVKYVGANQGGIFLVNDSDRNHIFLEMTACYAYDRRKFLQKKIEIGEGLVGRCYQEGEKIFMTDIPKDYIKITSGLGEDNPRCLLIVPLKYNDYIYGIIELASFEIFEPYKIEFIEQLSTSIAATIASVKANIQTAYLLEQSQMQAEEMAAQEEEMRQNMEELRATQEQMARREAELLKEIEELRKRLKQLSMSN